MSRPERPASLAGRVVRMRTDQTLHTIDQLRAIEIDQESRRTSDQAHVSKNLCLVGLAAVRRRISLRPRRYLRRLSRCDKPYRAVSPCRRSGPRAASRTGATARPDGAEDKACTQTPT